MAKKQNFNYFDSFEKLSEYAVEAADLLINTVEYFSYENLHDTMLRAHEIEHKGDGINHQVFEAVAVEFITPIEREDIIGLAQTLDSVLDNIEDIFQCFYMYDVHEVDDNANQFAQIIKDSCVSLNAVMKQVHNFKKAGNIKEFIVAVNDYEEAGDRLYAKSMHEMFANRELSASYQLVWSSIYTRFEKCCDACEHVADLVATVLLKNS